MGAVIFLVFAVYLVIAAVVIAMAAHVAKARGKNPWIWGTAAGLVVYLLAFWDYFPTVVVHKIYCATEGGFWISKTMDQWKSEHPGIAETLVPVSGAPSRKFGSENDYTYILPTNQRFEWRVKKKGPFFLHRWRHEEQVVDSKTSEVLARYVDFSTGYGHVGVQQRAGLKFWLQNAHCSDGAINQGRMLQFMLQAKDPAGRSIGRR